MDTSLPWLRDRGPLSSRQRETGKCVLVCWISLLCMGGGWGGGRAVGGRHRVTRTLEVAGVILGGAGTEINRV